MTLHRVNIKVVSTPDSGHSANTLLKLIGTQCHMAFCSCGWLGMPYNGQMAAAMDGHGHTMAQELLRRKTDGP